MKHFEEVKKEFEEKLGNGELKFPLSLNKKNMDNLLDVFKQCGYFDHKSSHSSNDISSAPPAKDS